MWIRILKEWFKCRKQWDAICNQCGKCCYVRSVWMKEHVVIHYDEPCENLDEETHLCRIYDDRFRKCDHCGKVTLFTALFNRTLPNDCAYRQKFRLWEKEKENGDRK